MKQVEVTINGKKYMAICGNNTDAKEVKASMLDKNKDSLVRKTLMAAANKLEK